jgi:hypothetical protein
VNVAGLPWAEIDFPYDLERARREVWPAMAKSRSTWRRLRWAALGLVAVGLASAGWLSSSQVGPASVDWETLTPTTGTDVTLTRKPSGSQRWWLIDGGDSVAALLRGPGAVRVEYRYLLAPRSRQPGKYVVELSVDGESFDWKILKATPDSSAALPGYVVGDRDRMKVELSPGDHILIVKLLAGTGEGLLTRIRQAE